MSTALSSREGLCWLEFPLLQQFSELRHACFTRHGGYSLPPFDSLNFKEGIGDSAENIAKNFEKIQKVFQIDTIHYVNQIHSDQVLVVNKRHPPNYPLKGDGLVTQLQNVAIMAQHADCQAAIFYDPITKTVATVHAGWRGSIQNIYHKTVELLKTKFHAKAENIFVAISPSLGPDSSEFLHYEAELPPHFLPYQFKPYHFDFWAISENQLLQAGILPYHIAIAKIDTMQSPDFFSYRRNSPCGRNATIAWLT